VETLEFDFNWGSLIPVMDSVGFLAVLLALSVGFSFHLLCSHNSSMDASAVIVVLAVFSLVALSLRIASSLVVSLCALRTGRCTAAFFQKLVMIASSVRHAFDD
jgi:hypothetical protein